MEIANEDLQNKILFGDLKLKAKNKTYIREGCVFSFNDTHHKQEEIIEVINFKVVGTKSQNNGYTEVKASEETRNKITGAYE